MIEEISNLIVLILFIIGFIKITTLQKIAVVALITILLLITGLVFLKFQPMIEEACFLDPNAENILCFINNYV